MNFLLFNKCCLKTVFDMNRFLLSIFLANSHTTNFTTIIILQNNSFLNKNQRRMFVHHQSKHIMAIWSVTSFERKIQDWMIDLIQDFVSALFPFSFFFFKLHKSPSNIRLHLIMYTLGPSKNFLLCFHVQLSHFSNLNKGKERSLFFTKSLKISET